MGLRDRRSHHDPVGKIRKGEGRLELRAVKNQILIDLVREDPEVVRPGDLADRPQVLGAQDRPGGVMRRVQKNGA